MQRAALKTEKLTSELSVSYTNDTLAQISSAKDLFQFIITNEMKDFFQKYQTVWKLF